MRLLEQAFAPEYRADVERALERAVAVSRVWVADMGAVPVEVTQAKLRTLVAQCVSIRVYRMDRQMVGVLVVAVAGDCLMRIMLLLLA